MMFEVIRQVMNMAVTTTNLDEYLFAWSELVTSLTFISPKALPCRTFPLLLRDLSETGQF